MYTRLGQLERELKSVFCKLQGCQTQATDTVVTPSPNLDHTYAYSDDYPLIREEEGESDSDYEEDDSDYEDISVDSDGIV